MKTTCVVLGGQKLKVLKKHLEANGLVYTEHSGPIGNTSVLFFPESAQSIIEAANKELKNETRHPQWHETV